MLNYNQIEQNFNNYLISCYKNALNQDPDNLRNLSLLLIDMLNLKYHHTLRVVKNISKVSKNLNMSTNYENLANVSGLLHDIGRFKQALIYHNYYDYECFQNKKNHGDIGEEFLKYENGFNILGIDSKYHTILSEVVKYHSVSTIPMKYNQKPYIDEKYNPDKFITENKHLNNDENIIVSLLLQMVRDADKIDILYQRSNEEIKSYFDILNIKNDGIENVIKRWGINKQIIKVLNSEYDIENKEYLQIPTLLIPKEKLVIPKDIKHKIENNKPLHLKELQTRADYNFIITLWWTIYTFLTDLNFVYNIRMVKDSKVLDKIYALYPTNYQELISWIINYAKEVLIEEALNLNGGIYVKKRIK